MVKNCAEQSCWWPAHFPSWASLSIALLPLHDSDLSSRETTCLRNSTRGRSEACAFSCNTVLQLGMSESCDRNQMGPSSVAPKACPGSTENGFLRFFRVCVRVCGERGDKNRCIGTLLPPDCGLSAAIAGSEES